MNYRRPDNIRRDRASARGYGGDAGERQGRAERRGVCRRRRPRVARQPLQTMLPAPDRPHRIAPHPKAPCPAAPRHVVRHPCGDTQVDPSGRAAVGVAKPPEVAGRAGVAMTARGGEPDAAGQGTANRAKSPPRLRHRRHRFALSPLVEPRPPVRVPRDGQSRRPEPARQRPRPTAPHHVVWHPCGPSRIRSENPRTTISRQATQAGSSRRTNPPRSRLFGILSFAPLAVPPALGTPAGTPTARQYTASSQAWARSRRRQRTTGPGRT